MKSHKPKKPQQVAPYIPGSLRRDLMIKHQAGKTNAELSAELGISESEVAELLRMIGKTENIKVPPEPSEFKVNVHIPQGKVIRAEKPDGVSSCYDN